MSQIEINFLYEVLGKLNQPLTPAQQLEAVSSYAQHYGATQGVLFSIYQPEHGPLLWAKVIAEWVRNPVHRLGEGTTFSTLQLPFPQSILSDPPHPTLIEDMLNAGIDPNFLPYMLASGVRGAAILPLNSRGQWLGILWFTWDAPHTFTDEDERVYHALLQQMSSAMDLGRFVQLDLDRAMRNEHLLKMNTALSQVKDEAQIVGAISLYAQEYSADAITLNYVDSDDEMAQKLWYTVAMWKDGETRIVNWRERPSSLVSSYYWLEWTDEPMFIEDFATDSRIDDTIRQDVLDALRSRAFVGIPLYSGGHHQGMIFIMWFQPHRFSPEEKDIYTSLAQTIPSVIAIRRAYIAAEEARRESSLLYKASSAINAATTLPEVVAAVEDFDSMAHSISLSLWENCDFDTSTYFEIVATGRETVQLAGTRYPNAEFPVSVQMRNPEYWVMEDIANNPKIDETSKISWISRGTQARIGFPLIVNNRWLGTLTFLSKVPRTYSEREKRLVFGIGDIVAAAVERIRLQQETENSRQRALLLAEISARLSQATDEPEIMRALDPLCEHYKTMLSILAYGNTDEKGNIIEVKTVALNASQFGPLETKDLPVVAFQFVDFPLLRTAYEQPGVPIFIENSENSSNTEPEAAKFAEAMGWPAAIVLPLQTGNQWQGVLAFIWFEPQVFSSDARSIFMEIQPAVASIVGSRRAYVMEQQRARELATVAKVSAAAASILDERELLRTVVELAKSNFEDYHLFIYLYDEEERMLVSAADSGEFSQQSSRRIKIDNPRSLIAHAAGTGHGVIVNDILRSPDYSLTPMLPNANSEMAVPMKFGNKLIGVLDVQSLEVNRFSEADIWVMDTLSDLIAVAVQNARLYTHAQELAVFEERNRIARELHDSVSQALYGIALGTRTATKLLDRDPAQVREPLEYVLTLAEAGLAEMRALIFELRPESLEHEGLVTALSKQLASIQARHGIQTIMDFCEEPDITLEMKAVLYRIGQEALHNAVKHSQAQYIELTLQCQPGFIELKIVDNGIGFDTSGDFPGHLGLKSMNERAVKLHGFCEIASTPGAGTRIRVKIPRLRV